MVKTDFFQKIVTLTTLLASFPEHFVPEGVSLGTVANVKPFQLMDSNPRPIDRVAKNHLGPTPGIDVGMCGKFRPQVSEEAENGPL